MKEKITKNQKLFCVYTVLALIFLFSLDTLMLSILPKSPNPNPTNDVFKRLTKEELEKKLEEKETFILYHSKYDEDNEKVFLEELEKSSVFPLYEYRSYISSDDLSNILPIDTKEENSFVLKIKNGKIAGFEFATLENEENIEKLFHE